MTKHDPSPITPIPDNQRFKGGGAYWIRRVNIFHRFARLDLALLNNGAWETLLDDLYTAMYGAKRNRDDKESDFNRLATRESVREAQRGLQGELEKDSLTFKLTEHTLNLWANNETGFFFGVTSEHFPTQVYWAFAQVHEASWAKPKDFLTCGNEKCKAYFVPLRKPRQGKKSYCSKRCANLVAAKEYRMRNQSKAKKEKERLRSKNRYEEKVRKKYPKAPIKSRKRKQKEK